MTTRIDSLWLGLLAVAALAAGCSGQTDPCAGVSKSVACLTVNVQGYTGQLDTTTFVFSGAEVAQQNVALVDSSKHKVTKAPFTVGFALPNLMAPGGTVDVQCLAQFNMAVVAFGTASVSLTPGTHATAKIQLSAALGDMDFGDLADTGDMADTGDLSDTEDLSDTGDLSTTDEAQ